ncbi:hypothetical protein Hanom_Chr09g00805041 [Helianthus anomalus]
MVQRHLVSLRALRKVRVGVYGFLCFRSVIGGFDEMKFIWLMDLDFRHEMFCNFLFVVYNRVMHFGFFYTGLSLQ